MSNAATARKRRFRVTRRGFLLGTGAAGVGLALGVTLGRSGIHRFIAGQLAHVMSEGLVWPTADPDAWFEISPDDVVRFNVIKMEMGQGIHTALTQIAADELGARWEQMDVQPSSTAFGPPASSDTYGSFSVSSSYDALRHAAASLRSLLIGEATRKRASLRVGPARSPRTMCAISAAANPPGRPC